MSIPGTKLKKNKVSIHTVPKIKTAFDVGSCSMNVAYWKGGGWHVGESRLSSNVVTEEGKIHVDMFTDFLRAAKKEIGFPGGAVALVLPSTQCICRQLDMPRMDEHQLRMNLPYEFVDFIQGDARDYNYDYALNRRPLAEERTLQMLAGAAPKNVLGDWHKAFSKAGLKLARVMPSQMALLNQLRCYEGQNKADFDHERDKADVCFVDLGHKVTRVQFFHEDRIVASRDVPFGGEQIELMIADELDVEPSAARIRKMENYENILEADFLREYYEHLTDEVTKVLNFYNFTYRDNELDHICLIGGGAEIPILYDMILEQSGLSEISYANLLGGSAQAVYAAGALVEVG